MSSKSSPEGRERPSAYAAALRLLSARAQSRRELYDKLIEKDYTPEEAQDAVNRCVDAHFLDDEQYAQSLVRRYGSRYGKRAVAAQLAQHGIDRETAEAVLESWESPDADDMLRRLLRGKTDEASLRRATAALYRRGFSGEQIRSAAQRFREDFPEETET